MDAIIKPCTCKHEGQDTLHSPGMRVHNPCALKSPDPKVRCTVCLKETPLGKKK